MDDIGLTAADLDAAARGNGPPAATGSVLPAPMRNNNPGALMPGGKLASFASPEEGIQALDQNLQRYGKSGVNTLRGVVSKWAPPNENNTDAYVSHVAKVTGLNPDQPIDLANPYTRLQLAAGIVQHENGTKASYQPASSSPASTSPGDDLSSATLDQAVKGTLSQGGSAPAGKGASPAVQTPLSDLRVASGNQMANADKQLRATAGNFVTGIGANIVGGYRGLATLLTGGTADDAANDVNDYVQRHTYQGNTDAERQAIGSFTSAGNPLNWPQIGIEKGSDYVADKLGPEAGVAAKTLGTGALLLSGLRGKPGSAPVEVGPSAPGSGVYRPLQVGDAPSARMLEAQYPQMVPTKVPQPEPVVPAAASTGQTDTRATSAQGATKPGQAIPPGSPTADAAQAFREIDPSDSPKGTLEAPTPEMQRRAQVLQSVGIDRARESSLTGDKIGGSTDLQISKEDSPRGRFMLDQITNERQALADHATQLVQQTGGTLDEDQTTAYQRGETILAPLDQLRKYYDTQAANLYDAANERAKGQPVALDGLRQTLSDDSEMTSPAFVQFRDAATAFAKKNGMLQEDGSISGTALQAETFRKWLNQKRDYSNSSYVDALKESLDNDVTSSGGDDLYTQARALWRDKKQTLDNPDGIAKVMQEDGVNRAIPKEQVAPKIARMPVDQFGHVVDTLKNVPDQIQPAAQSAINEIRAHFANQVRSVGTTQQGQWNAKGVMQYLRDNAARMNQVFTPEEMANFQNLNEAGQIVAKDQSYPGASVQQTNLARAAAAGTVRGSAGAIGATTGYALGGPVGATLGHAAGQALGNKVAGGITDRAALKATQRRTAVLSDLLKVR